MGMDTTLSQIQLAAYLRWERRGRNHGHDEEDWAVAQRQHRFSTHYRLIASIRGDDPGADQSGGGRLSRRCRFCQQVMATPSFSRVMPESMGSTSPACLDQCEECESLFAEGIDQDLVRFLERDSIHGQTAESSGIPIAAFKGLVKMALGIMPLRDLEDHEDTIEWITNPDHNFDFRVFSGLSCVTHQMADAYPSAWAAVAEKTNDGEPWASRLFFLGMQRSAFMISVPLNPRDEDLDLTGELLPDIYPPAPFAWDPNITSRISVPIRPERSVARRSLLSLQLG